MPRKIVIGTRTRPSIDTGADATPLTYSPRKEKTMKFLTLILKLFRKPDPALEAPVGLNGPHRKTALKVLAIGMVATRHSGGLS